MSDWPKKITDAMKATSWAGASLESQAKLVYHKFEGGHLTAVIETDEPMTNPAIEEKLVKKLEKEKGVEKVSLAFSHEGGAGNASPGNASPEKAPSGNAPSGNAPPASSSSGKKIAKTIIGIASAKGGVGKSTLACNLAVALAGGGKRRVGLLDADIHGPSQHILFGLNDSKSRNLVPQKRFDVSVMSMGHLIDPDTPVVWRGPMITKALQQLSLETDWGELDLLIIDFPPGTGDVALSLSRLVTLAGVVLVSTPQKLALEDTRRGLVMFNKMDIPIWGIIENMAGFVCPHCNEISELFPDGGMAAMGKDWGVNSLGRIPLMPVLGRATDAGTPFMATSEKENPLQNALREVAEKIEQKLEEVTPA